MARIDAHTEILEDYEPLLELKAAFEAGQPSVRGSGFDEA
jgi:hypothetical protein